MTGAAPAPEGPGEGSAAPRPTRLDGRWVRHLLPTLVLGLALFLRLYRLDLRSPLVTVELETLDFVMKGPLEIILPPPEGHFMLPLSRLVQWAFVTVDPSLFALRLPSAIFGTLSVAWLYLLCNRLLGRRTALLAAFMLALAPFHVHYSQLTKQYTILTFLCLASVHLLVLAVERNRARYWVGLALANYLGVVNHPLGFVLLGLEVVLYYAALAAPTRTGRRSRRSCHSRLWLAVAATLLLYGPYWHVVFASIGEKVGVYRVMGDRIAWDTSISQALSQISDALNAPRGLWALAYLPVFLIGLAWRGARHRREAVLTLLIVPLPVAITLFLEPTTILQVKYLLVCLPVYLMAISAGFLYVGRLTTSVLARGRLRSLLALVVPAVLVVGLVVHPSLRRIDWYYGLGAALAYNSAAKIMVKRVVHGSMDRANHRLADHLRRGSDFAVPPAKLVISAALSAEDRSDLEMARRVQRAMVGMMDWCRKQQDDRACGTGSAAALPVEVLYPPGRSPSRAWKLGVTRVTGWLVRPLLWWVRGSARGNVELRARGRRLIARGETEAAQGAFAAAAIRDPRDFRSQYALARIAYKARQWREVGARVERVMESMENTQ